MSWNLIIVQFHLLEVHETTKMTLISFRSADLMRFMTFICRFKMVVRDNKHYLSSWIVESRILFITKMMVQYHNQIKNSFSVPFSLDIRIMWLKNCSKSIWIGGVVQHCNFILNQFYRKYVLYGCWLFSRGSYQLTPPRSINKYRNRQFTLSPMSPIPFLFTVHSF